MLFHDLKIEIAVKNGLVARYYSELMYVAYDAPYCWLYFADQTKYKVESTLKFLLDNLPDAFLRCNRSTIINVFYYKEYSQQLAEIVMDDKKVFTLSRRSAPVFNAKRVYLSSHSLPVNNGYSCMGSCEIKSVFCRRKKTLNTNGLTIDGSQSQ